MGFVIRSHLVSKLASLPKRINDRLMVMKLQLTNKQKATLISAYAPTMTNADEVKDQFYEGLDELVSLDNQLAWEKDNSDLTPG